jgi:hypothetical protein
MDEYIHRLLNPNHLYSASEVLARPSPVPRTPGIYAWYFNTALPLIDVKACHQVEGGTLLYTGISPKAPPRNGRLPSRSTLRRRIQYHYCGNAEGSTLRKTLGCLLSSRLHIQLRRVGGGARYTFTNPGEQALDRWMHRHAFVTWVEAKAPWEIEGRLLASGLSLPLNIDQNPSTEAVALVKEARSRAKCRADELAIISDSGGPRRAPGRHAVKPAR